MRTLKLYQQPKPAPPDRDRAQGFSLVEVLVAITILVVGLSALATLVAQSLTGTERARYLSTATTLTSEKLEDLARWPSADPHVSAGGNLTTDSPGTINYFDDVDLSNVGGQVSESTAGTTGGVTTYNNVIHSATGYINDNSAATSPANQGAGIVTFHRRWLIEPDPVVNGITLTGNRRVTVLVTLSNSAVVPPVSFQMSMIRP